MPLKPWQQVTRRAPIRSDHAQPPRGRVVAVNRRDERDVLPIRAPDCRSQLADRVDPGWVIERTIAWFGAFRRLVVRYERSTRLFLAFFQFAAALIALRRL